MNSHHLSRVQIQTSRAPIGESHFMARGITIRASLEADQAQLAKERKNWEARLKVAQTSAAQTPAARNLAEHACATLDGQLQDSHAPRADLAQQRDRLQDQCDAQSAHIQMLRTQLDENQVDLRTERERTGGVLSCRRRPRAPKSRSCSTGRQTVAATARRRRTGSSRCGRGHAGPAQLSRKPAGDFFGTRARADTFAFWGSGRLGLIKRAVTMAVPTRPRHP